MLYGSTSCHRSRSDRSALSPRSFVMRCQRWGQTPKRPRLWKLSSCLRIDSEQWKAALPAAMTCRKRRSCPQSVQTVIPHENLVRSCRCWGVEAEMVYVWAQTHLCCRRERIDRIWLNAHAKCPSEPIAGPIGCSCMSLLLISLFFIVQYWFSSEEIASKVRVF